MKTLPLDSSLKERDITCKLIVNLVQTHSFISHPSSQPSLANPHKQSLTSWPAKAGPQKPARKSWPTKAGPQKSALKSRPTKAGPQSQPAKAAMTGLKNSLNLCNLRNYLFRHTVNNYSPPIVTI